MTNFPPVKFRLPSKIQEQIRAVLCDNKSSMWRHAGTLGNIRVWAHATHILAIQEFKPRIYRPERAIPSWVRAKKSYHRFSLAGRFQFWRANVQSVAPHCKAHQQPRGLWPPPWLFIPWNLSWKDGRLTDGRKETKNFRRFALTWAVLEQCYCSTTTFFLSQRHLGTLSRPNWLHVWLFLFLKYFITENFLGRIFT